MKCWLDDSQAGIKITRRNINNLRYADNNSLMVESDKDLKSLLMRVKEDSEKAGLKLSVKKLRSYHLVSTSWQIEEGGNVGLKLTIRKLKSWHPVPSLHGK